MARSSTTRRGNGAGYGGPANGASTSRLAPAGDPESDRIRAMVHDAGVIAHKEAVAEQMRRVLLDVALAGEAETARINAADKLLDRLEGKALAKQQISGEDGAALVINVVKRGGD